MLKEYLLAGRQVGKRIRSIYGTVRPIAIHGKCPSFS